MLKKLRKPDSKGFTIIEVMIVLAIAALILLIVLLAVPALQRSSRNTQRKNDVSAISSALSNFVNNNNGSMPAKVSGDGTDTNVLRVYGSSGNNSEQAKLGYYNTATSAVQSSSTGKIFITTASGSTTGPSSASATSSSPNSTTVNADSISIVVGETCNGTGTGIGSLSTRSFAIFYVTETGSGNGDLECVGS